MPALRVEVPPFAFGEPDAWGLVGESMAMWSLRERIATVGPLAMHVLLSGPSGAGKELVARALHAASPRQKRPLVSRNAATLPPGLVDAELFGNVRGYPNPTMAERPGLIGAADGGTLFLDELGELSHEVQAHLLRVLDEGGEYQRLGESHTRHSDLRLVGATNRSTSALKHDLLQRFRLRIEVVGLDERRSDIPLLLVHLIGVLRQRSATLHERGLVRRGGRTVLDLDLGFLSRLISRPTWVGHVRELDAEVWQAFLNVTGVTGSSGGLVGYRPDDTRTGATPMDPTRSTDPQLPAPAPEVLVEKAVAVEQAVARADDATAEGRAAPNDDPGKEAIARALDDAGGNISGAARGLGLTSRFALYRLMQRHGIVFRRRDAE
jgi:transcriptional regulator with GAF, ATPase, and Fis domain